MHYDWQSTNTIAVPISPDYQHLIDKITLPFHFDEMADEVCGVFGAIRDLVFGRCKRNEEKFARWIIWKIMLSYGYTKRDCGKIVGSHDHTAVIFAMNKIDWDIEHTPYVTLAWGKVKKYMKDQK